jgi:endonuclease/exonuclease/phosphatase family metal-dependent hydrolase
MKDASLHLAPIVLLAVLFTLLAQVARTMFPLMYLMGEDWNFMYVGLIALAVYAAPIFVFPVASLEGRTQLVSGTIAIAVARLTLQLLHPIPTWLAMAGTAAALIGATLVILGRPPGVRGRILALGIVLGLALDTALRIPFRSWDLAWQDGVTATVITLALVAATLVALFATLGLAHHAPDSGGPLRIAVLGPFLALQLLLFQNLGYVGSQAGIGFAGASFVVLGSDALGLWLLALTESAPPARRTVVSATVGAAVLGWSVTVVGGILAIAAVVILQVLTIGLVGIALGARVSKDRPGRTVASFAGGSLAFVVLTFLWLIDVDMPLPFPRELVPTAAVVSIGVAAVRSAGITAARLRCTLPLALVGLVAVAALVLPAWLWLDRPSDRVHALNGDLVRIVQYNVRGALDTDGQVNPDAIARAIASSNPDVVILQEVARGWPVFGSGDLLPRLEQRLDMTYRFEPAADDQFGNAILSRLPMTPVAAGRLPSVSGKQARSFLIVRLDAGSGRSITVVGTHLETDARSQIDALLAAWGTAMPAVIAGDMNMQPLDTANVALFTGAGLIDAEGATGDPCRTTSAEPTSNCDRPSWVWLTQDLGIHDFWIGTVAASDHLPVHITVALPSG